MSLLLLIGQDLTQEKQNLKNTDIFYLPCFQFIISQAKMEPSSVGFDSKFIEHIILLCTRLEAYCNSFSLEVFHIHRGLAAQDQELKALIDTAQLCNFGLDC